MLTSVVYIGDVIENTILRFYVDDETVAAVQYTVDNSIGIGSHLLFFFFQDT